MGRANRRNHITLNSHLWTWKESAGIFLCSMANRVGHFFFLNPHPFHLKCFHSRRNNGSKKRFKFIVSFHRIALNETQMCKKVLAGWFMSIILSLTLRYSLKPCHHWQRWKSEQRKKHRFSQLQATQCTQNVGIPSEETLHRTTSTSRSEAYCSFHITQLITKLQRSQAKVRRQTFPFAFALLVLLNLSVISSFFILSAGRTGVQTERNLRWRKWIPPEPLSLPGPWTHWFYFKVIRY